MDLEYFIAYTVMSGVCVCAFFFMSVLDFKGRELIGWGIPQAAIFFAAIFCIYMAHHFYILIV